MGKGKWFSHTHFFLHCKACVFFFSGNFHFILFRKHALCKRVTTNNNNNNKFFESVSLSLPSTSNLSNSSTGPPVLFYLEYEWPAGLLGSVDVIAAAAVVCAARNECNAAAAAVPWPLVVFQTHTHTHVYLRLYTEKRPVPHSQGEPVNSPGSRRSLTLGGGGGCGCSGAAAAAVPQRTRVITFFKITYRKKEKNTVRVAFFIFNIKIYVFFFFITSLSSRLPRRYFLTIVRWKYVLWLIPDDVRAFTSVLLPSSCRPCARTPLCARLLSTVRRPEPTSAEYFSDNVCRRRIIGPLSEKIFSADGLGGDYVRIHSVELPKLYSIWHTCIACSSTRDADVLLIEYFFIFFFIETNPVLKYLLLSPPLSQNAILG